MNVYKVDFHPAVESDYEEIYHWYELQKTGLGELLLSNVRELLNKIIEFPETYSAKGRKNYREAMVEGFPYLIVYKVYPRKKRIFVSSIHHTKKNPSKKYRK